MSRKRIGGRSAALKTARAARIAFFGARPSAFSSFQTNAFGWRESFAVRLGGRSGRCDAAATSTSLGGF